MASVLKKKAKIEKQLQSEIPFPSKGKFAFTRRYVLSGLGEHILDLRLLVLGQVFICSWKHFSGFQSRKPKCFKVDEIQVNFLQENDRNKKKQGGFKSYCLQIFLI